MGGSTNRAIVTALQDPTATTLMGGWAYHVCIAHNEAKRTQDSFTPPQRHTTDLMAPRGNIIFSAGDPTSMVEDRTPTIETEVVPDLLESVVAPKGVRLFIAAKIRKIKEW